MKKSSDPKKQSGFTLIELVIVIAILAILAATALPKFVDLKSDAELAAVQGVAGAVNSAFGVNYAAYAVNATKAVRVSGTVSVNAVAGSILAGGVPNGYTITAAAASTVNCGTTAGGSVAITVSNSNNATNKTAPATLICTG